ncbi:MAG: tetratricopeptide repeat protein [Cytophagales bacterium]|nr:tetratricopeptide repeat protein [Cytophagales bacterium]
MNISSLCSDVLLINRQTIGLWILVQLFGFQSIAQHSPQVKIETGDSLFALGDSSYFDNDYDGAIDKYLLALIEYRLSNDTIKTSNTLNDIGLSFKKLGLFDSALTYYNLALELDLLMLDSARIIARYRNLSNLYVDRGNFTQASEILLEAREIALKTGHRSSLGGVNNALGSLYENQEEFNKAINYYHQAKWEYQWNGNQQGYGIALNNLGKSYIELGISDSAFFYLHQALSVKKEHSKPNSIAYTLHDLGCLFLSLSSLDSAEQYFLQAYDMREKLSDQLGLAQTANELGLLYLKMSDPSEAFFYITQARKYAQAEGTQKLFIENTHTLSKYYLATGDTLLAYNTLDFWANLKDSILSESKFEVLELQSAFELKRKEEERKQQEKKALNQSRIAEQRLLIIGGVTAAALMLVGLVLYVIRQRSKIKALNENLKLVNRDMYHRKKNDYMRLLNEISETNVTISEDIRGQLLASAAVDESLYEEAYDMVDLDDYLDERLEDIADAQGLSAKEVALRTELDRVKISGQRATAILLVLNELMTNSAKHSFADRGGIIHIVISGESGHLRVIYKDDGAPFVSKARSGAGMGQKIIEQVLKTLRTELSREVQGQWNQSSFVIKV